MRLAATATSTLLALIAFTTTTTATPTSALFVRSDPGGPCKQDNNCYGGAKCCSKGLGNSGDKICKLGACDGAPNPGANCQNNGYCFGGAQCCSQVCHVGSCRMDGSCDEDDDCYGWCHNNKGKCNIAWGKTEGTCKCPS